MKITPEKVHAVFSEWMKSILSNVHGVVAIDGKQARRTADPQKRPLHVVSAFAQLCIDEMCKMRYNKYIKFY